MRQFISIFLLIISVSSFANSDLEKGREAFKAKDYSLAFSHFEKAAEQNISKAQSYLGYMYSKGQGVKQD